MALNIAEVVFVPVSGQPVEGEANVRGALEQFLSLNLPITMTVCNVFQSGNTGLAVADSTICPEITPAGTPPTTPVEASPETVSPRALLTEASSATGRA